MDVLISFDEYNTTIQSFLIFDEPKHSFAELSRFIIVSSHSSSQKV